MAFLDILKGRKREESKPKRPSKGALKQVEKLGKKPARFSTSGGSPFDGKKHAKSEKKGLPPKSAPASVSPAKTSAPAGKNILAAQVLIKPHITERSTFLSQKNIYTFKIPASANKILIKNAIKEMYGFKPIKVRITKAQPKKLMVRGKIGEKPGFKKALVYLSKEDKIDFV